MDQATRDEPATPRRFWWLTRGGAAVALLLVGVAVAHLALGRWAKNRIEARRSAWVAAGNPDPRHAITGNPPPLTGSDNAAVLIERAIRALPPLTPKQITDWDMIDWSLPLTGTSEAALRSIVEQDRPALALLRAAMGRPRVDFGYRAVAISGLLPRLNDYRNLANHLMFATKVAAHDGDLPAALDDARDIAWLGEATVADGELLVTSLVSTGINALGAAHVRDELILGRPGDLTGDAGRAAWHDAAPNARRLIALLLDADYDRDLRNLGFRGEFASAYSFPDAAAGGGPAGYNFFTAPFLDADLSRFLDRQARRVETVRNLDDYAAFRSRVTWPAATASPVSLARASTSLASATMDASYGRAGLAFFRVAVERRATAVLLALKLYAADHGGEVPATLDALAPAYLPFVPTDPMSPDAAPLRYKADGTVPIVWSVGESAADTGPAPNGFGLDFPLRPPPATDGIRVMDFSADPATRPSGE